MPTSVQIDEAEVVDLIKKELLDRVSSGTIPGTVASFSELHDFLDANTLGGMDQGDLLARLEEVHGPADAPNQGWVEAVNRIQGKVDAWIKAGGLRTYRFCVSCREQEGDCHCEFMGKTPMWETRRRFDHEPALPEDLKATKIAALKARWEENQRAMDLVCSIEDQIGALLSEVEKLRTQWRKAVETRKETQSDANLYRTYLEVVAASGSGSAS